MADTPQLITTDAIRRRYWSMMEREYGAWMLWVLLGGTSEEPAEDSQGRTSCLHSPT